MKRILIALVIGCLKGFYQGPMLKEMEYRGCVPDFNA